MDLSLSCLMDPRFSENLKSPEAISSLAVRIDFLNAQSRRILKEITELNPDSEGVILLSQELGKMSVILPEMAPK